LPVELLLIIFKLAYKQEASQPKSRFSSPSLFPYAAAAVCTLWRDVMSLIPCVWKHFVIVVGSETAIPPSAILSQLSWCHECPVDLIVVSKDSDQHPVDSQRESAQVLSVMNILINPHIHRFQEICFDVTFSSSLPPFPDGFHGTASALVILILDCLKDDGASTDT
jgi:hypothetical protein